MTTQASAGLRVKIPVPLMKSSKCQQQYYVAAVLDLCSGAARVGLKSGTVRYHGTVVTVILFATDVDLLESSSQQSLFCRGFASCVCGVRDVARLGIL